ncbi:MAG: hypothetical protein ABSG96_03290 [Terracidiphilus sp.]
MASLPFTEISRAGQELEGGLLQRAGGRAALRALVLDRTKGAGSGAQGTPSFPIGTTVPV